MGGGIVLHHLAGGHQGTHKALGLKMGLNFGYLPSSWACVMDQNIILLMHLASLLQHGCSGCTDLILGNICLENRTAQKFVELFGASMLLKQMDPCLKMLRCSQAMDIMAENLFNEALGVAADLLHVGGTHGEDFVLSFQWPAVGQKSPCC